MKLTHYIHVCLIILLIHYFGIINLVQSDKIYYILIQQWIPLTHYELVSVTWAIIDIMLISADAKNITDFLLLKAHSYQR